MKLLFITTHIQAQQKVEKTVLDCISSFKRYSKHHIEIISHKDFVKYEDNIRSYDAICLYKFHFTYEKFLTFEQKLKIKKYKGCKIVFLEEEYFILNERIENIKFLEVDYVFSASPQRFIDTIYKDLSNYTKIIKVFHGYIEDYMLSQPCLPWENRDIDVSYRALKLPMFYGRLGVEKYEIADKFLYHTSASGLKLDISNKIEDRLWGDAWHNLLRNSKAVLGVECSSGVIDFSRKIFDTSIEYEKRNQDTEFSKVEKMFFNGLDGAYNARAISPRHFEYAAFKNLMLLFEGEYEGILVPYRHYVPIKKDFSNINNVIDYLNNYELSNKIIENAYNEIALNKKFHFSYLVDSFDKVINDFYENKPPVYNAEDFIENKEENKLSIYDNYSSSIREWFKKNVNYDSIVYKSIKKVNNQVYYALKLWSTIRIKYNLINSIIWFAILFGNKDVVVQLCNICDHIKARESSLDSNIITLQCSSEYCEIRSAYGKNTGINFEEFIDYMANLKHRFLFVKLHDSWFLKEDFRSDKIFIVRPIIYKFLRVRY